MLRRQRKVIAEVKKIGRHHKWSKQTIKSVIKLCLMCIFVETGAKIYANKKVPESFNYKYDAVGDNYLSVGMYQQQTPMWGSCESCMDPASSTRKFVNHVIEEFMPDGMTLNLSEDAHSFGAAVQHIQGSAYPDRYEAEWDNAKTSIKRNYPTVLGLL